MAIVLLRSKPASATCVSLTSWSSPKFNTAPSAKKTSEKFKLALPRVAPSSASGKKEVSAVNMFVLMPEVPLSIAPNPAAIVPVPKAPVVTMLPPPTELASK